MIETHLSNVQTMTWPFCSVINHSISVLVNSSMPLCLRLLLFTFYIFNNKFVFLTFLLFLICFFVSFCLNFNFNLTSHSTILFLTFFYDCLTEVCMQEQKKLFFFKNFFFGSFSAASFRRQETKRRRGLVYKPP